MSLDAAPPMCEALLDEDLVDVPFGNESSQIAVQEQQPGLCSLLKYFVL